MPMSNSKDKLPLVSVIVVNYNGRHLIDDCLGSLEKIKYPRDRFEVIVVDNDSYDSSVSYIKTNYSQVKLIESDENLGFTGGNNLGLEYAKGDYIVLLNSDTKVDQHWLNELAKTAQKKKKAGLVSSKLLFATPFIELTIYSGTIPHNEFSQDTDFSPMGVLIEDIKCRTDELQSLVWYQDGFYLKKEGNLPTRWTNGLGVVLLPFADQTEETYSLKLHGYPVKINQPNRIKIKLGQKVLKNIELESYQVKQLKLTISKDEAKSNLIWLVQNAGSEVLHSGHGKDRGSILRIKNDERQEFYEQDSLYFNQEKNLKAACGASLLIKRKLIDKIEMLDGYYFMYYEDLDLSLRAWRAGFDIAYCPNSIVYHKHRATTGKTITPFFLEMSERNHLFFITTHFPLTTVVIETFKLIARTTINWLLTLALRFSQNIHQYHLWKQRFEARKKALFTYFKSLPRLFSNRRFWQKEQERDINQLINSFY